MASFEIYYPKLKKYEGGYASADYAKKMGDSGGETYKGIARNYNKDWEGWKIIDAYKAKNGEPKYNTYINDPRLDELAKERSKKNYWDAMNLDNVKNQSLAELIGDYGFNSGIGTSAKAIQKIVGVNPDGRIGKDTVNAINNADQKKVFDELQKHRVELITNSSKISDKNKPGLLSRAKSFAYDGLIKAADVVKKKPLMVGLIVAGTAITITFSYIFYKKVLKK